MLHQKRINCVNDLPAPCESQWGWYNHFSLHVQKIDPSPLCVYGFIFCVCLCVCVLTVWMAFTESGRHMRFESSSAMCISLLSGGIFTIFFCFPFGSIRSTYCYIFNALHFTLVHTLSLMFDKLLCNDHKQWEGKESEEREEQIIKKWKKKIAQ